MALYFLDQAGRSYNYGTHGVITIPDFYDYELYFLDGNDVAWVNGHGDSVIELGAGDDWLQVDTDNYCVAYGGSGDDTMVATDKSTNYFYGGQGDDWLIGKSKVDYLYGGGWNDTLEGGGGDDSLYGGGGNDVLRGGSGIDRMSGDDGDDAYEVTEQGDRVLEHRGEGHDTIYADINFAISENVEDIILFGTDGVRATGNGLGNGMAGNTANNVIKGLGGGDNLNGFEGKDKLYGGGGKDYFSFHLMGTANADRIMDFSHRDDTILLERDVFVDINGGPDWTAPTRDQFRAHASGKAGDAEDRLLYDTTDGKLYYDRDGTGTTYTRQLIAIIDGHPSSFAANDILIV